MLKSILVESGQVDSFLLEKIEKRNRNRKIDVQMQPQMLRYFIAQLLSILPLSCQNGDFPSRGFPSPDTLPEDFDTYRAEQVRLAT